LQKAAFQLVSEPGKDARGLQNSLLRYFHDLNSLQHANPASGEDQLLVNPLPHRAITRGLKIHVRNVTRDVVLADAAEVADTSAKRRTGLLKHTHLEPGDGLWIVPCESVHCFL
jgi:hypothetical protein